MIQRKQRIPMRDLSTMAAEDREAVEKNAMNGRIFNIFKVLAHHPKLVKRWTPFAGHILGKQTLPFFTKEQKNEPDVIALESVPNGYIVTESEKTGLPLLKKSQA